MLNSLKNMTPKENLLTIIKSTKGWSSWNDQYEVELSGIGRPPYTCAEAKFTPTRPDTVSTVRSQLLGMSHLVDITLEVVRLELADFGLTAELDRQEEGVNRVVVHLSPKPENY